MKLLSKEFYNLMQSFEKDIKMMPIHSYRIDREDKESMSKGFYYQDDTVNKLFIGYIHGYQYAKCMQRIDDLQLDE